MVSFEFRFPFLSGLFLLLFPSSSLPSRQFHHTQLKKSKTQKKGFFWILSLTLHSLLITYINQLYYIIHILLLRLLCIDLFLFWIGNKFFLHDVLPSLSFRFLWSGFPFGLGGLDVSQFSLASPGPSLSGMQAHTSTAFRILDDRILNEESTHTTYILFIHGLYFWNITAKVDCGLSQKKGNIMQSRK